MKLRRLYCLLACILCAAVLLAGCQTQGENPAAPQASEGTEAAREYAVRYHYRGQMVYEEQVMAGEMPQLLPTCAEPDYEGAGWVDAQGNPVEPLKTPVNGDCDYTAVVYPVFSNHVPYLFADENGMIRPDDALTGTEYTAALRALAASEAILEEITLPAEDEKLTKTSLTALLEGLFPEDLLHVALFNVNEGDLTRSEFAGLMNTLLDRFATETLVLEEGQTLPRDLALDRTDCDDVLEATLAHSVAQDGQRILDAAVAMPWTPGFSNIGGWLYYADENGVLLRDGQVGTMTFGPDGRYTSGDPELDAIVAEDLDQFIRENPAQDSFELLYTAFLHCRDDYKYVGRGLLEAGETGWEAHWAKQMFTSGAGNCYSYAAIFWAYARGLGYDAYCVSGWTAEEFEPHGWVEIETEEGLRIFDPELAMAYLRDGKNYEAVFNMEYALARMWPYYWP